MSCPKCGNNCKGSCQRVVITKKGERGERGAPGIPGQKGEKGDAGAKGDAGFPTWELVSLSPHPVSGTVNAGLINNTPSIDYDLPATANLGTTVLIVGTNQAANHTVTHATAGVQVVYGASATTAGGAGSLTIDKEDTIELTYIGSNKWAITRFVNPSGNALVFV